MYSIDLNSDMGESFGAYKIGGDEEIIKYVTTANVACGWHAGDPMVMDKVVRMAKERGVMVGAHPGYPDMMGFGRRKMVLSHDEIKNYVRYQIGALAAFTKSYGMKLQHVAPHGAMGNACQYDEDIASAIVEAICEYDKDLIVYYCAGAVLGDIAESKGLRTASEIFADRAYMDDLSLVPRKMEGSMITDEDIAIQRCVKKRLLLSLEKNWISKEIPFVFTVTDRKRWHSFRRSVRNSRKKASRSDTYKI